MATRKVGENERGSQSQQPESSHQLDWGLGAGMGGEGVQEAGQAPDPESSALARDGGSVRGMGTLVMKLAAGRLIS